MFKSVSRKVGKLKNLLEEEQQQQNKQPEDVVVRTQTVDISHDPRDHEPVRDLLIVSDPRDYEGVRDNVVEEGVIVGPCPPPIEEIEQFVPVVIDDSGMHIKNGNGLPGGEPGPRVILPVDDVHDPRDHEGVRDVPVDVIYDPRDHEPVRDLPTISDPRDHEDVRDSVVEEGVIVGPCPPQPEEVVMFEFLEEPVMIGPCPPPVEEIAKFIALSDLLPEYNSLDSLLPASLAVEPQVNEQVIAVVSHTIDMQVMNDILKTDDDTSVV